MHLYREIYLMILLFASSVVHAEEDMLDELLYTECAELCYTSTKPILNHTISTDNKLKEYKALNHTQHLQMDQLLRSMEVSEEKLFISLLNLTNSEKQLQLERERVKVSEKELSETQIKLNNTENQLRSTLKKLYITEEKLLKIQILLNNTEKTLYETQLKLNNTEKSLKSVNDSKDTNLLHQNSCQRREKKFEKIGDKYYYIEKSKKETWFGALQKCADWGSDLASLQTDVEWTHILSKLSAGDRYWMDGKRFGNENIFLSEKTGKALNHNKWLPGEPNNKKTTENCAEIRYRRGLNDAPCGIFKYFICESNTEYNCNSLIIN